MRLLLLIQLFLFLNLHRANGQSHDLIIQWENNNVSERETLSAVPRRWLAEALNIELYSFSSRDDQAGIERKLWNSPAVKSIDYNDVVFPRATPNDRRYEDQVENLLRTGFDRAWDLTTGGESATQDKIVVAILDAGFDTDHPDLLPNLWRNRGETPNDGLDNDNNGYVDDIIGWNMIGANPNLPGNTHGTQVIGALGAAGNNTRGIAGTNWDIDMMLLSFQSVAHVIEAYEYVRQQRKRWNETDGREGAFVVATNASFGIEGATCSSYEVWGSMYDELGKVGVLTAAATANRSWDVELRGDMPTDCPSDFLIGVANVGTNDLLFENSAFGRVSVDLAAPGEGTLSTLPGANYGPFGSTSAAAPYVTGAIALLYATPCAEISERAKNDPTGMALYIRDVLLSTTQFSLGLEFRTVSGGILDVGEAQRIFASTCGDTQETNFTINRISPNPASNRVRIETNALVFSETGIIEAYDMVGRLVKVVRPDLVRTGTVSLDFSVAELPAGMYYLVIRERDRRAAIRLVVK